MSKHKNTSLTQAPANAESVDAVMAGWVAAIADQVRNPVAGIAAVSDVIARELNQLRASGAPVSQNLDKAIPMMRQRIEALTSYIDSLRNFAEQLRLHRRPMLVRDVIHDAIRSYSEQCQDELIVHTRCTPESLTIVADPLKLQDALVALLRNAVEAVPVERSPEILVTAALNANDPEEVQIKICDNGDGFLTGNIDQLRRPFRTTKEAGNGLGLATADKIAEAHSGRLEFVAKGGALDGAEVHIFLPLTTSDCSDQ